MLYKANNFTSKLLNHLVSEKVCLHCTIAEPHVHWTKQSLNLSLKVDFLFHSFLVITVVYLNCTVHKL